MKLKRILAILMVTIVAISVFAGCDVITKNEERDNNQVLATVNYGKLSATVSKGEFYSSFNSLAYYYVYYYGYTVEETADAILDSLTNRKLLILYARTTIAEDLGKDATVDISELMTPTMKDEAIKSTNESMQTQYDSIFEELWSEAYPDDDEETADDEETTTEEDTDTVRPSRPDKADAEIDYDSTDPVADAAIPFFEQSHHYADDYTAEQKVISDKAVAQLKKQLAENYVSYDYYLNSAYETQLLQRYQRKLGINYVLTDADIKALVSAKRDEYISLNKEKFNFNTESNYSSALSSLGTLVYHPASEQGYGYVYNILLQFSDEQSAQLTAFKKEHTDEALIAAYRNALAQQITVNVTNPDYDESIDKSETNQVYSRKDVAASTIIDEIKAAIDGATGFEAKREEAIKWFYLVNDDTGMYDTDNNNAITNGNLGYLITPDGKTSTYVDEFTGLGRLLISGTVTDTLTDTGATYDASSNSGLGAYGWCVTDYGIHIMFVSYIPYDASQISDTVCKTNNVLPLDYIIYYGRYDDENDKDKTLEETIFDTMKSAFISKEYTAAAQNVINSNKDNIAKNDKLWKKIMKDLNDTYNS